MSKSSGVTLIFISKWKNSFPLIHYGAVDYHTVKLLVIIHDDAKLIMLFICLENKTKSLQHESNGKYIKIVLVGHLSGQTQRRCRFFEKEETNL